MGRGLLGWLRGDDADGPVTQAMEPAVEDARVAPEVHDEDADLGERYRDMGLVGRGAMARVHQVYDSILLRTVAMKVLDKRIAAMKGEEDRFLEEAQITGQLDHPNIPAVHDLGTDDEGTHFFTMKYVRGETLDQMLKAGLNLRSEQQLFRALHIYVKICEAVSFAHSRGVIHCDLKPANVMVGKHGEVYVTDWGIARLRRAARPSGADADTLTGEVEVARQNRNRADEGKIIGSLGFMSPEQARGKSSKLDERSDVFSLGAILYRMLVGRPPYSSTSEDELLDLAANAKWAPPQELAPAGVVLPPRLCAIAMKAMAKAPADRYQNAEELKDDVESYLSGSGRAPVRKFAPGEVVMHEGDPGSSAYVIEKGRCVAYKVVNGRRQVLREMGPGEVFGEMAILTGAPRTATVEALEELTARKLTADALAQELGQTFFMGTLLRVLAERFRDVDARATTLGQERDLQQAVLTHLALGRRDGERAVAAWKPLADQLAARFKRTGEAALAAARAVPGVAVHPERDEVWLTAKQAG